ncbi:MAG: SDR family oxidoreductase [Tepidisphaeraceae bacterium]|jgi:NAD(P)-dependent dehydrogenase (short-subunit alcohol dehydrogenase family)
MNGNKVALVTGANKGIGLEICRQLGKHGFTVILAGRDEKKVNEASARLRAEGLDVQGVVLDVTKPASALAAARWLTERHGKLDVLVNNAGVSFEFTTRTRPSQLTMETLRATYETNFFGAFTVTQHMLPLLRKSASARIINQSSTLGSLGTLSDPASPMYGNNLLAYNSSKTALNGLTLALAKDLASERISVNSVCPGWVKTDMGSDAAPRTVEQGAAIAAKLATMDKPPTGKYLDDAGEIRW